MNGKAYKQRSETDKKRREETDRDEQYKTHQT